MHDNCTHGPGVAWSEESFWQFFSWCDTCDRFRSWARYFEVYSEGNWWWECAACLQITAGGVCDET